MAQRFAVPASEFCRQLDLLSASDMRACTVAEARSGLVAGGVAVTFDDGHLGQYDRAFPALVARGMTATFYVTTSWIGTRPGYVSWAQLHEMASAGMSIQSHTHSHPFLSELEDAALVRELERSKAELDAALSQETDELALPGGDLPRRSLRGRLADAGYRTIATSRWGLNAYPPDVGASPVLVNRCTIGGVSSADRFLRIAGGDRLLSDARRRRETVLAATRQLLGPSRYARCRSFLLELGSRLRPLVSGS